MTTPDPLEAAIEAGECESAGMPPGTTMPDGGKHCRIIARYVQPFIDAARDEGFETGIRQANEGPP